uniref:Uncharacterized protein n=1 Tax=Anguilla anguilla TaxID=7936 RepID=A0A0E9VKG1_ANGAN
MPFKQKGRHEDGDWASDYPNMSMKVHKEMLVINHKGKKRRETFFMFQDV